MEFVTVMRGGKTAGKFCLRRGFVLKNFLRGTSGMLRKLKLL